MVETLMNAKQHVIAIAILTSIFTAHPAAAQYPSSAKWTSRFLAGRVLTDSPSVPIFERRPPTTVSIDDGFAATYDLSREVNDWLELHAGFGFITLPAQAVVAQLSPENVTGRPVPMERLWLTEYHVGALYSFPRLGIFNAYAGPVLGGVARDVTMTATTDSGVAPITLSSTVGAGAQFGVRIACACEGAAIDVNVRRTLFRPQVTGGAHAAISPWVISAGISIRH